MTMRYVLFVDDKQPNCNAIERFLPIAEEVRANG